MKGLEMGRMSVLLFAVVLTLVAVGGLNAYAETASKNQEATYEGSIKIDSGEQQLAGMAKISLADAVQAALSAAPGQALKAELETDEAFLVYGIEILGADGTIMDVTVDAGTGKVLLTKIDTESGNKDVNGNNHENGEDHENGEND